MKTKNLAFIDYWDAIDAEMMERYGVDTFDTGIEPDELAGAQEEGCSPKEFVQWFGDKYGLTRREDMTPQKALAIMQRHIGKETLQ